jgi:CRP-like cAMP-binding protein
LFTKYAPVLWPNYRYPTPKAIETLMSQLGDDYGLLLIDPAQPLVRYVSWFTRETDLERSYWQNSTKPDAQFYIRTNSGYAEGHGLLTLIPLQVQHILAIAANYLRFSLKQRSNSLKAYLQQASLTKKFFAPDIPEVLRTCDFFSDLDQTTLEKIARGTELKYLPGGRYLFRENEAGNSLFVILSGTVYVTIERDGRETIIDTRETGEVFGEIALLIDTLRTASIRAAMPTTVLQVNKEMVKQLMKESPGLEDKLWDALLVRRFNTYVSNQARFSSLNHQARHDWFARGVRQRLTADDALQLGPETSDARFVFVPYGTVETIEGGDRISYAAPELIEINQSIQLHVNEAVHIVLLPTITA